MDDAVHVEVEVVELEAVGVGAGEVEGEGGAVGADDGLLLHGVGDGEWVSVGEPPVERRNTHRRRDNRKRERRDPLDEDGGDGAPLSSTSLFLITTYPFLSY